MQKTECFVLNRKQFLYEEQGQKGALPGYNAKRAKEGMEDDRSDIQISAII